MKLARYVLVNGIFSLAIYYGLFHGVETAKNLALFMAWFCIVCAPMLLSKRVVISAARPGVTVETVPAWMDATFDFAVVGAFAATGHFVVAALYLVHAIIGIGFKAEVRKLKIKNARRQPQEDV